MVVIIMGVAGSGKTLIGAMLAKSLQWTFADADNFHPPANIEKMTHGIPLTDEDRAPWIGAMHDAILGWINSGQDAILACSALKQRYRDQLVAGPDTKLVYLKGSRELIYNRLSQRQHHFMKPEMLASQFADLEEPVDAIVVDIDQPPEQVIATIERRIMPLQCTPKDDADNTPRQGERMDFH